MKHYSENSNQIWKDNVEKWKFAWDHYTGEYADDDKIVHYLYQKMQREGNKAFESRRKDPDPILHFSTAVDGINGIISQKDDTVRDWGELGKPDEAGSYAHALMKNADGSGTNWIPMMKRVGIKLTVLHTIWGLVEGIQESEGGVEQASVKVINPQSVVNWYPSTGNPTQVLVKENREVRSDITGDPEPKEVFTLFELDGWRRFTVISEKSGDETISYEQVMDSGNYEYWDSPKKENRVLPIFRVEMPLPRNLGYLLAKKQNHIFNFKSLRDHGASNLSLAILKIKAKNDKEYEDAVQSLVKGNNAIWEHSDISGPGHTFMSPDGGYLSEAGKILQTDVEHFYHNAFREFGDAARQATATEILQKSSTGIEAFLALLVSSIDEFENQSLMRIEQVYFSDPSKWGAAYVQRDTSFQPENIEESLEKMKKRFFGDDPVPVPDSERAQLIVKLLEKEGVVVEDEEAIEAFLEKTINTKLADAVGKLSGKGISVEESVRVLRPSWDEAKVSAEVGKINSQMGASIPDPFSGA